MRRPEFNPGIVEAILLLVCGHATAQVDWSHGNWAFNCDFPGQDISGSQTTGEACGNTCAANPSCTHFTWTNFQSGTCFLKRGTVSKSDAVVKNTENAVCGIVLVISWYGNDWALGCDFPGLDLSSARTSRDQCGPRCAATSGCTHYTWTSFSGGTCWMKYGTVSKIDAVPTGDNGMLCGIVSGSVGGTVGPIMNGVLTTRHGATESGACSLPDGSYAVTFPVALGDISSLQSLRYTPAMCGHILRVNCGNGPLDIIVTNSNLGGGLDLYASSWSVATGNRPPGQASCSVQLTNRNPLASASGGMTCYYAPDSEKNNQFFKLLGVFNTGEKIVSGATLAGRAGSFNGVQPYFSFSFGPISGNDQVVFTFTDGTRFLTTVAQCIVQNNKKVWS